MSNELVKSDIAVQQFDAVRGKILEFAEQCNNILVVDEQSSEHGKELAKAGKKIKDAIEERRLLITKPYLDEKKRIDDFVKNNLMEGLDSSIKSLREKLLAFEKEQERIRVEAQRKKEAERRAKEEEMERKLKEAAEQGNVQASEEAMKLNEEINSITENAPVVKSKDVRKVWTYEVIDESLIPRQFLTIDEKKVKQAISAGTREIPGINIFQESQLNLR